MLLEPKTLQVVVIGGGSVGLLYAARLALAGQPVTIVTRSSLQANQLNERGLSYQRLDGESITVPVTARPIEEGLPVGKLYLLTVKQPDLGGVLPALHGLSSEARVIALQNGMGHYELLRTVLTEAQCFFAINTEGARRLSPTEVVHTGTGILRVGSWEASDHSDPLIGTFVQWAQSSGIEAVYEKAIQPFAWRKLIANALINPLTALFEIPNGALLENEHTKQLMHQLFMEAATVAAYAGQKIGEADLQEIVSICRNTSRNLSSMLQDIQKRRPTEIQSINGYLVRLGKEAGIPVPLHETLLQVILLKSDMGIWKEGGDSR